MLDARDRRRLEQLRAVMRAWLSQIDFWLRENEPPPTMPGDLDALPPLPNERRKP
jgi:hypothetical protein